MPPLEQVESRSSLFGGSSGSAVARPAVGRPAVALPAGVRRVVRRRGEEPVRYEAVGAEGAPVVVVLGGISATSHVARNSADTSAGWWDAVVGPGLAIDTSTYRVVGIDFVACGRGAGSQVTTADQGDAIVAVLAALGEREAHAVIGSSYGAMVALALAEQHPTRVGRIVAISGAHRSDPMTTAIRAIQRRIVALGERAGAPGEGVALARALAMTTYRTRREFAQRFDSAPAAAGATTFPAEQYVIARGRDYATRVTPGRLAALSLSLDLHNVRPERVHVPATLVAIEEDQLVPIDLMQELQGRLAVPAELVVLSSLYGHDAFLKETARLTPILRRALLTPTTSDLEARRSPARG